MLNFGPSIKKEVMKVLNGALDAAQESFENEVSMLEEKFNNDVANLERQLESDKSDTLQKHVKDVLSKVLN